MTFPPTFNILKPTVYQIVIRDSMIQPRAMISTATSFEYYLNFNDTGTWVIDLPSESDALQYAVEGAGIIVLRNDQLLFSGPIDHFEDTVSNGTSNTVLAGVTDDTIFDEWLAAPCASPFSSQAYDVRTGTFQTVAQGYITDNMTSGGAYASGRTPYPRLLGYTGSTAGATVTGSARFDQMSTLLRDLAQAGGGLGYKVQYAMTPGYLQVVYYTPTDRSAKVQFSLPLGNLKDFKLAEDMPTANAFFVGGQGDGASRTFVSGGDAGSQTLWNRRIEKFVDRRDTNDSTQLNQEITTQIAANASKYSMGMTPLDTGSFKFGTDYFLGDKVTFVAPVGTPLVDYIRQIHVKVDSSGEVVTPVIGTPGATDPSQAQRVYNDVDALKQRIRDLESHK